MRKSFKYRIFPTRKQKTNLFASLDACRWLYNHFIEERKNSWEKDQKSISRFDQMKTIPILKKEHEFLSIPYSQCLQDVAIRIDLAFRAFFRRVKVGEKPGYPCFRGKERYDSFTYTQNGFSINDNSIRFSKIGNIKTHFHTPLLGEVKTCNVKKSSTGKWYVVFSCIIEEKTESKTKFPKIVPSKRIGIDVGIESFATFSDGTKIENPKFFKEEQKKLAKAQQKLSKQKLGSKERKKARKVVARIHERIRWKRENFAHQNSRRIVNDVSKQGLIVVEDLTINNMKKTKIRCLNRSIADVAWGQFLEFLKYKAEWASVKFIQVNPAYTSQTCSECGNRQKLKLSDRIYGCPCCSFVMDRDQNAAINILSLGMHTLV